MMMNEINKILVVSKFEEDISWTKNINCDYIIIDKSDNPIGGSISRPNIGREAESILYYIIEYYDNLPKITIFLQGDPRGNPPTYTYEQVVEKINSIDENYQFSPFINNWFFHNDINTYWDSNVSVWHDKLFKIGTDGTDNNIRYATGAEFVVPKENILCRTLEFYKYLHSEVMKFDGPYDPKICNCGLSAWTLELLWGKIFDPSVKLAE